MIGTIYELLPLNCELFYIGSTDDMKHREDTHKSRLKTSNLKVYNTIRDCGGKFKMNVLYEYECDNKTELREEEQRCIDRLKPQLNMRNAYVSKEDRKKSRKIRIKKYYQKNRDTLINKNKIYYQNNRDTISNKNKIYRQNNRDAISNKAIIYYQQNKEKMSERDKLYYEKNKHKISEKNKEHYEKNKHKMNEKTMCECGCDVMRRNLIRHRKTKTHKRLMVELNGN